MEKKNLSNNPADCMVKIKCYLHRNSMHIICSVRLQINGQEGKNLSNNPTDCLVKIKCYLNINTIQVNAVHYLLA